jgi:hypothetical protein
MSLAKYDFSIRPKVKMADGWYLYCHGPQYIYQEWRDRDSGQWVQWSAKILPQLGELDDLIGMDQCL